MKASICSIFYHLQSLPSLSASFRQTHTFTIEPGKSFHDSNADTHERLYPIFLPFYHYFKTDGGLAICGGGSTLACSSVDQSFQAGMCIDAELLWIDRNCWWTRKTAVVDW
jgi:hypothetical protein